MRSAKISARLTLERRSCAVMALALSCGRPGAAGAAVGEAGEDTVDSGTQRMGRQGGLAALVKP
jgi:hypothetical protein